MAILVNGQQQEQDQDTVNQQGPISVSGTPTSTIASGSAMGTAGAAPARKASGSGRFTNIQSYLQASQGSGEKIAGRIGQKVGQQTEKLGQAVETAKAVNPQLEAEKQRIAQASGFAQQLQQDPTKLVQDPNQVSAFAQLRTGQTGLQPIQQQAQQSFDTAQSELGRVQELAGMTGSEAGRFELLRQSLGRPSYTRGQQRLDQLLIQSGGGNILGQLQQETQGKARAGEQLLGTTKGDIEARLAGLGTEASEAQKLLTGTLGGWDDPTTPENEATGVLGGLQTDLTGRAAAQQAKFEDMYARARAGLESGEIDRDVAEMLGLTNMSVGMAGLAPTVVPMGQSSDDMVTAFTKLSRPTASKTSASQFAPGSNQILLGDVSTEDLLSRLQKGFDGVTPSGVATEADYAKLQALKQLSGQTGPTPIELDKAKLGQAGVAARLDAEQLQKDIQGRLGTLQEQYGATEVDPFAAQLMFGQGAQSLIGKELALNDAQLVQKYGSISKDPNKIRQTLTQASSGITGLNAAGRVDAGLAAHGLINRGATYGNIDKGQDFLADNLRAILNRVNPNIASAITQGLTGQQVRDLALGTQFGQEMTNRMTKRYGDLGLSRTLKIK